LGFGTGLGTGFGFGFGAGFGVDTGGVAARGAGTRLVAWGVAETVVVAVVVVAVVPGSEVASVVVVATSTVGTSADFGGSPLQPASVRVTVADRASSSENGK
jgi:hypothetical protein